MSIDYNKLKVSVCLDNVRHNYRLYRQIHDNVIPVIKSDAYGHGLVEVADALKGEGVETYAVGFVHEAVKLRQSGCKKRIVALLGPVDDTDFAALWDHDILAAISHGEQLGKIAQMSQDRGPINIGLKFDTGMRRLGFQPSEASEIVDFLKTHPNVTPTMISSHLASADMPDHKINVDGQAEKFQLAINVFREAGFNVEANLANSAGSLAHELSRLDSLRMGIAMYGGNPFHGTEWAELGEQLKPVMQVSTKVMQVHPLKKGEGISYGWTHTAERDCTVAILGVGYADNYSRSLSNTGFVNIQGHRAPILGRVCMQMTAVDVTDILGEGLDVRPGDDAWLLGGQGPGVITPEDLAGWWNTITYEVFCLLGMNQRQYI